MTSSSWQAFCWGNVEDAPGQIASTEAIWEPPFLPVTSLRSVPVSWHPLPAICADLSLAVNSSRVACGAAADNTAAQMLSGQKDGNVGDSRANICIPCGNNRAALCKTASHCDATSRQTKRLTSCVLSSVLPAQRGTGKPTQTSNQLYITLSSVNMFWSFNPD